MTTTKRTMQVTAEWLGNRRFQTKGPSGYPILLDSNVQNGGEGTGNSPLELVIIGLVGCMGMGVNKLLDKMRQTVESLNIDAEAIRSDEVPHAITEVHLTFTITGDIVPSRIWRAIRLEQEQYCPVAASLKAVIIPHVVLNGSELQPSSEPEEEDDEQVQL